MAEKKEEGKESAAQTFRKELKVAEKAVENITNGLKSASGRVRALAVKHAFKTQKHDFIKKHILPLMETEKSKKVLRTIGEKLTRKSLNEKLKTMTVKKVAGKKAEAPSETAEAPKA